MLRNDLNNLVYKGLSELRTNIKNLDYEKTVGNVLKKWDYSYTLQPDTGDFTITAAPGCYVRAELGDELYKISLEINYNDLSASSKEVRSPILITPYSIQDCKSVFDILVTGLQTEYAKCEAINKGKKGTQLINSLVRPVLRKLKLQGVKVERCDEELGYFRLVKQLAGNVSLSVKISFNDYEEGCSRLAEVVKSKPDYNNREAPYYYHKPLTNHRRGRGLVDTMENAKMVYNPSLMVSEHNNQTDSELSKVLSDMGYIFSKDKQLYTIYISADTVIQKNDENHFWFRDLSNGLVSDKICMDNDEFVYLLKLIAVGTTALDGYNYFYWKKNVWYSFLTDILPVMLPTSFKLYYVQCWDKSFFVINNGNEFYTFDTNSPKLMQSLYGIIDMIISGKTNFDEIEKEQVEIHIKQCN